MSEIANRSRVTHARAHRHVPHQRSLPLVERVSPPEVARADRPWGAFDQFTLNEPTTVKVITVEPRSRLSLQRHEHRAEFWEVLDGVMDVEVDGMRRRAAVGERVWVPQGAVHRMGNSSDAQARILEIGFGTFDENDIERLEDDYSR